MATFRGIEDLKRGNEFLLYMYDGTAAHMSAATPIAYATSCGIDISADEIDANNKFSCRWATKLNGNASYTISSEQCYTNVSGLTSFDALMEKMTADGDEGTIYWVMGSEEAWSGTCETNQHLLDTAKPLYYGKGVITSLSLNAGVGEVVSCSCTIAGSGAIEMSSGESE